MFEMADTFTDKTILVVTIQYGDHPKMWTYILLKAGGLWYATGGGKAPQMAGWGAIKRWLSQSGRVVKSIELVTRKDMVWLPNWRFENGGGFGDEI